MYASFSIIFTLSALLSLINYKYLKLPNTVGHMSMALVIAVLISLLQYLHIPSYTFFCDIIRDADFSTILLDILLGFLLFGGALHVNISELNRQRLTVFLLATLGVLLSTAIVGFSVYFLSGMLAIEIDLVHCLLFGALISPTDPVAVLAILNSLGVKDSLRLKIEGESLFNDGVGVIVFSGVLLVANSSEILLDAELVEITKELAVLFFKELLLGLLLGYILGILFFRMIVSVKNDKQLSTILSFALVFGGYSIASMLETSGPLAMVVAGLYIGHKIRQSSFNDVTENYLEGIWQILDEALNGVLFVMMGLALHLVPIPSASYVLLAILTIILVLLARAISVGIPYSVLIPSDSTWKKTVATLTWGGLRGGISLALAFSVSQGDYGDVILLLTYTVVCFSILVQGLSIKSVVKRLYG